MVVDGQDGSVGDLKGACSFWVERHQAAMLEGGVEARVIDMRREVL